MSSTRRADHQIHALVDAIGRPILIKLTNGQAHDGRSPVDVFDSLKAGTTLLADRAYEIDASRQARVVPAPTSRNAQPIKTSPHLIEARIDCAITSKGSLARSNAVEQWHPAIKRGDNAPASVQRAPLRIWLRTYER